MLSIWLVLLRIRVLSLLRIRVFLCRCFWMCFGVLIIMCVLCFSEVICGL